MKVKTKWKEGKRKGKNERKGEIRQKYIKTEWIEKERSKMIRK